MFQKTQINDTFNLNYIVLIISKYYILLKWFDSHKTFLKQNIWKIEIGHNFILTPCKICMMERRSTTAILIN